MRIPVWGFLPALAFLSLPLRAEESQAPQPIPIAVVKTWGELRRQPALKLEGDAGTVRLGLEAASGPQGSQPLLYALVETMRSDLRLLDLDDCPLNLRVQIPGAIIVESKQNADRLRGSDYPELARCLFAQPIPIAAVGTHAIQLRDPLGQVLAQGAVKGRMELDHAWSAFEPPTEEEERLEATESLVESVSLSRRGAAYPSLPLHALMMEAQFKGGKWETNVTDQELLPSLHLSAPQQEALAPFEPRMEERLARLFDGLGDSAYETREQAELDLRALGPAIKARLKTEAERTQDPEVGVRLGRLLARWAPSLPSASTAGCSACVSGRLSRWRAPAVISSLGGGSTASPSNLLPIRNLLPRMVDS
ncbi:MAG: hypothetical protein M5U26_00525 [Planctomycetota bacterium]|nr:hypothetical protein [Planctomycetota bacterium]